MWETVFEERRRPNGPGDLRLVAEGSKDHLRLTAWMQGRPVRGVVFPLAQLYVAVHA